MSPRATQLQDCCAVIVLSHFGESPDGDNLYSEQTVENFLINQHKKYQRERSYLFATLNEYEFKAFSEVFARQGWKEAVRPTLNPRTGRYVYSLFKCLVSSSDRKKKTSIFKRLS